MRNSRYVNSRLLAPFGVGCLLYLEWHGSNFASLGQQQSAPFLGVLAHLARDTGSVEVSGSSPLYSTFDIKLSTMHKLSHILTIVIITTALCACNRTSQKDVRVLDIVSNAVWGENHAYSEWNGKTWEVSGDAQSFQALYAPVSVSEFDSMKAVISADFGEPTYTNLTLPAELIPSADTGTFWMAWKNYNRFCYWCNDTINIGLGLFEKELVNDAGYAYLYIERL